MQRINYYQTIHKTLRRLLYLFSIQLGTADVAQDVVLNDLYQEFVRLSEQLIQHAEHEEKYFDPFIKQCLPQLSQAMSDHHKAQALALETLNQDFIKLKSRDKNKRYHEAQSLYLAINQFIADYLHHLYEEEALIMPQLWARYSDETLMEPLQQLIQSMTPEEYKTALKHFIPAINQQECQTLLAHLPVADQKEILGIKSPIST